MREKTIRKLVKLVEASDIESLTVRRWWSNVHIVKRSSNHSPANGGNGGSHSTTVAIPKAEVVPTLPAATAAPAAAATVTVQPATNPASPETKVSATTKEIKSPMVGTFYTSPEPGAPPFVDAGQRVARGQTVCIIEAMKLMNEIEAEFDGVIVKRLVENAEPVEFGQPLFLVETA